MNPRYAAFVAAHGECRKNWEYMHFIAHMKKLYLGCVFETVRNQDEFTDFINKNAHRYQPSAD